MDDRIEPSGSVVTSGRSTPVKEDEHILTDVDESAVFAEGEDR
jgi:hypothetical protein